MYITEVSQSIYASRCSNVHHRQVRERSNRARAESGGRREEGGGGREEGLLGRDKKGK